MMERKEKKQRIIDAARQCFARYGYEKTTMEDIGKQVGLNKTSLYHYFNNKDKIFSKVILQERIEYFETIRLKLKSKKKCNEIILTYLKERLLFLAKVPSLASLSIEMILKKHHVFEEQNDFFYKAELAFLNEIIKDCIEKGQFKECDSYQVAQSIITIADALKMKAVENLNVTHITEINFSEFSDELLYTVSLILDGLKK
ncbi:MAG: TetR/AcrR family transcriptional regulator [Promethearchaeota archaeon]